MTAPGIETNHINELLPFYVNGTLDDRERAEVEAAIERDPALEDDLRTLSLLRQSMQEMEHGTTPGEFGLARLMRDIDRTIAPQKPAETFFFKGLAVAAATAALVIGIGWVTLQDSTVYEQASGGDLENVLTVAFREEAKQSEITELLFEMGLVMTDGPTAIGLYRLKPVEDGRDLGLLADALRAREALVESVDAP